MFTPLFLLSSLTPFLPLPPVSSLSPSSLSLLFSPLPTPLERPPFANFQFLPIYSLFPRLSLLRSPLSFFHLPSFFHPSKILPLSSLGKTYNTQGINECHCKEITCHYMVCKTHFLMTAPNSDMSLYSPCHYLVLSLYSAGIGVMTRNSDVI